MSLIRLLPAWFHAVADYAVGALLVAPWALGFSDTDGGLAAYVYLVM